MAAWCSTQLTQSTQPRLQPNTGKHCRFLLHVLLTRKSCLPHSRRPSGPSFPRCALPSRPHRMRSPVALPRQPWKPWRRPCRTAGRVEMLKAATSLCLPHQNWSVLAIIGRVSLDYVECVHLKTRHRTLWKGMCTLSHLTKPPLGSMHVNSWKLTGKGMQRKKLAQQAELGCVNCFKCCLNSRFWIISFSFSWSINAIVASQGDLLRADQSWTLPSSCHARYGRTVCSG